MPAEALNRVFKAILDLLIAYKEQLAVAAKEVDEDENDMDGLLTDDEDDEDASDKEMGSDAEDGDEADSVKLEKLAAQAKFFRSHDEENDYSNDDFSDDEELQSPIDEVDPFVFFVDTIQVLQASDPVRLQSITQSLDFNYQAIASLVAQYADQRRSEIEKEKMEKASSNSTGMP